MNVIKAIKSRKSVRSFNSKKVPLSVIRKILEVSSQAPSGSNTQPWNVHVLMGKSLKKFVCEMSRIFK